MTVDVAKASATAFVEVAGGRFEVDQRPAREVVAARNDALGLLRQRQRTRVARAKLVRPRAPRLLQVGRAEAHSATPQPLAALPGSAILRCCSARTSLGTT